VEFKGQFGYGRAQRAPTNGSGQKILKEGVHAAAQGQKPGLGEERQALGL
jgi:hypothetical protein